MSEATSGGNRDGMNVVGKRKDLDPARPVDGPDDKGGATDSPVRRAFKRRYAWFGTAASLFLLVASIAVLWHLSKEITWEKLHSALTGVSTEQLGIAFVFVVVSYLFLTCYDALALKQLKLKVPYSITALASFTSYAVSFTLGFPLLTAGTIRYWIYSSRGLGASKIAALTVIAGFTFWLGMGVVLGLSLIVEASQLAGLAFTSIRVNQGVGLAALAAVLGYLVWVSMKRRHVTVKHWRLELPGASVSFGQMLVGIGDVCAAAAVLYVLMPSQLTLDFSTFVAIYVLAAMLGIASNVPGGAGVFEATIMAALASLPPDEVLGSLLLFRVCYYLVPFLVAIAMLGVFEVMKRLRRRHAANDP